MGRGSTEEYIGATEKGTVYILSVSIPKLIQILEGGVHLLMLLTKKSEKWAVESTDTLW